MPVSPDDVLVPLPWSAGVDLGDGFVVYDPRRSVSHQLNPTAALVWRCFDGEARLAELIDDFTDAFPAPREVIETDVLRLVSNLVDLQLVVAADEATAEDDDPDAVIHLKEPPCGCLGAFEQIEWAATSTFKVGRTVFGIRTSDLGAHQLVDSALAAYAVDDPDAEPYYALEVKAPPVPDDGSGFLALYLGRTARAKVRDTASLWRALEGQLRPHIAGSDTLILDADAVVGPRGAAVVPRYVLQDEIVTRLTELGHSVVWGPIAISVADASLELEATALDLDRSAVAAFEGLLPSADTAALPASVPVVAWTFFDHDPDNLTQGAQRLMRGLSLVANGATVGAEPTLDLLQRLMDGITACTASDDVAEQLHAAISAV